MKYIFYLVLFFVASMPLAAQQLSGMVINEHDRPLAGASIRLEERSEGTMSLTDGRFRLLHSGKTQAENCVFGLCGHPHRPAHTVRHQYCGAHAPRRFAVGNRGDNKGKKDPAYAIMREVIPEKRLPAPIRQLPQKPT
ncbi:MAG: hypothetical protein R3B47_06630 [Bacteroidia bacterium]